MAKMAFLKKVKAKHIKFFNHGNIYNHRGDSEFSKCNTFFANEASFDPKTTTSAVNSKLRVTSCLSLS